MLVGVDSWFHEVGAETCLDLLWSCLECVFLSGVAACSYTV